MSTSLGAREVDGALHELEVDGRRRRVVREGQDDHPRPGPGALEGLDQVAEEILAGPHRDAVHVRAGEHGRVDVDRVARARHDGRVARLQQHPHEVREPLLGADGRDRLRLRVELDREAAPVEVADRRPQLRDAAARRVAVVPLLAGRLLELRDRDLGRRDVGVAEAEVDDVLARPPQVELELVRDREDVRRQRADAAELHPTTLDARGRRSPAGAIREAEKRRVRGRNVLVTRCSSWRVHLARDGPGVLGRSSPHSRPDLVWPPAHCFDPSRIGAERPADGEGRLRRPEHEEWKHEQRQRGDRQQEQMPSGKKKP